MNKNNYPLDKDYIMFIGDSFAAAGEKACNVPAQKNRDSNWAFYPDFPFTPWTDQVSDQFPEYCVLNFARTGQSWVYYRHQMIMFFRKYPEILKKVKIVIACHTSLSRLPSDRPTLYNLKQSYPNQTASTKDLIKAQEYYERYIYSDEFHTWATIKWFEDFSEMFKDQKVINFHCFSNTISLNKYFTHSMNFSNIPLIVLSIGELTGTDEKIMKNLRKNDSRCCHFCPENHKALADLVVNSINNYQERDAEIDLSTWYQPNPNAINFISGKNFGTK